MSTRPWRECIKNGLVILVIWAALSVIFKFVLGWEIDWAVGISFGVGWALGYRH